MVSFQCDACGDTVKKPKLDKHYQMCHAAVTCIDCFATFNSPAEFKGHTSCISEAEKYQKSLYKGPKTRQAQNASGPRGNDQKNGDRPNNYYNNAGGKYQQQSWGRQGGGGWGGTRYEASGANVTPLGTPVRMSPVTAVVVQDEQLVDAHSNGVKPAQNELKAEEKAKAEEKKAKESGKKEKKDKKRKAQEGVEVTAEVRDSEEPIKKKAKTIQNDPSSSTPAKLHSDDTSQKLDKKSKKDKKDKKAKKEAATDEPVASSSAPLDGVEKKAKKNKKEKKTKDSAAAEQGLDTVIGDKSKKRKREEVDDSEPVAVDETSKKDKRSKKHEKAIQDVTDKTDVDKPTAPAINGDVKEKKKKEKKDKSKKDKLKVPTRG